MSAPKKVDGIALSKPLTPSEAAKQYDTLVRQIREDETPPEYINPDDALVELDTAPTEDSPLDAKPKDELAEFKRSKQVKDSFGDWETLASIEKIKNVEPRELTPSQHIFTKREIDDVFRNFETVKNIYDGEFIKFPIEAAGKIYYHKGFDSTSIIKNFRDLLINAIPFFNEKEILKEGHKIHNNIESYQHYVTKVKVANEPYYIRFTVTKGKIGKKGRIKGNIYNELHSSAVSEVYIYEARESLNKSGETSERKTIPRFVDKKLSAFFNSVNKKDVSKITDEKGEPLVVFHGTGKAFDKFDDKMSGGSGFHFTKNRNDAQRYASYGESPRIVRAFLSVKNPAPLDAVKKAYDAASGGNPQRAAHLYLKKLGYDGFVRGDDIVVFDAKQIIPIDNAPTTEGKSGGVKIVAPSAGATASSRYDVIPGIGEVSSARWFRPEKFADGSPNRAADADKA